MDKLIAALECEPALAWKVSVGLRGASETSAEALQAREQVRHSPLAQAILATCARDRGAYKKWDGAHWVLSLLADLGYPPAEAGLRPLMEDTFSAWLSPEHST